MNQCITLTSERTDARVYIFVDHIQAITPWQEGSHLSGIGNNGGIGVKENPEEIIEAIKSLNKLNKIS
jgi:hypothetical protein